MLLGTTIGRSRLILVDFAFNVQELCPFMKYKISHFFGGGASVLHRHILLLFGHRIGFRCINRWKMYSLCKNIHRISIYQQYCSVVINNPAFLGVSVFIAYISMT